jgi:hypothetical protein
MEQKESEIIKNTIAEWIKANKKQLLIALVFLAIGIIILNQLIGIYAKADLLLNPCELCIRMGNECRPKINFWDLNISLP